MMREDCWCFENEEYAAGVLAGKVIMWRLCAGVFRRNGCDAKSSVCLKRVNVMIGVLVFAGIGFLILFGVCLCLLRAGSEADDRVCMMHKKDDEKNSENIKKDIDSDAM